MLLTYFTKLLIRPTLKSERKTHNTTWLDRCVSGYDSDTRTGIWVHDVRAVHIKPWPNHYTVRFVTTPLKRKEQREIHSHFHEPPDWCAFVFDSRSTKVKHSMERRREVIVSLKTYRNLFQYLNISTVQKPDFIEFFFSSLLPAAQHVDQLQISTKTNEPYTTSRTVCL